MRAKEQAGRAEPPQTSRHAPGTLTLKGALFATATDEKLIHTKSGASQFGVGATVSFVCPRCSNPKMLSVFAPRWSLQTGGPDHWTTKQLSRMTSASKVLLKPSNSLIEIFHSAEKSQLVIQHTRKLIVNPSMWREIKPCMWCSPSGPFDQVTAVRLQFGHFPCSVQS